MQNLQQLLASRRMAARLVAQRQFRLIPLLGPELSVGSIDGRGHIVDFGWNRYSDCIAGRCHILLQLWLDGVLLHLHQIGVLNENPVIDPQANGNRTQIGHKPMKHLLADAGHLGLVHQLGDGGSSEQLADLLAALLPHTEDESFLRRVLEEPLNHVTVVRGVVVHARRSFGMDADDMAGAIRDRHENGRDDVKAGILRYGHREPGRLLDLGDQPSCCFPQFHFPLPRLASEIQ